jgi:hypothetical protein
MRALLHGWVAAAVALTLSISACGGGVGGTDRPTGRTVAGAGYEVVIPEGWKHVSSQAGEEVHLTFGGDGPEGAAITVSRITDPPPDTSLGELAQLIRQRLLANVPGLSASDLGPSRLVSLGGVRARVYAVEARLASRKAALRGLVTLRDGAEYTVIFAAAAGGPRARVTDYASILDSWEWKRVKAAAPAAAPAVDGEVQPAKGEPVAGSGYRFNLPRGWRRLSTELPPGVDPPEEYVPPDTLVAGNAIEGTPITASVLVEPTSSTSLNEFVNGKGAHHFGSGTSPAATSLGGIPAVAASREQSGLNDAPLRTETIAALDDGHAYVVQFAAPRDHFEETLPAFRSAVASWRWR